jgi:hypothetical protein
MSVDDHPEMGDTLRRPSLLALMQNKNSGHCQLLVSNPRYRGIIRDIPTL